MEKLQSIGLADEKEIKKADERKHQQALI